MIIVRCDMSNLESEKITKLICLFAAKAGIDDAKSIQSTIENLQYLNIDEAIDKILIVLNDLSARKLLTEDDILEYKDALISLNPQRYPSFSKIKERLYYLKEMSNYLIVDELEDRSIYYKKLTDDNIINITGEGGSGKSTLAEEYRKDKRYIVIDYDLIVGTPQEGTCEFELRKMLLDKYGASLFQNLRNSNIDQIKENFTKIYQSIISYFSSSERTIVLDGTQLRFIEDASLIKGEVIVLRPSLKTCLNRSVERFKNEHPNATRDEIETYKDRRSQILHRLNPLLNNLLNRIEQLPDVRDYKAEFDVTQIEQVLLQKQ